MNGQTRSVYDCHIACTPMFFEFIRVLDPLFAFSLVDGSSWLATIIDVTVIGLLEPV
jgi:lipoprotein signal peptidase